MKKVLIVVDMQEDFVTGSLGSEAAQAIIPNVKNKIEEYENRGDAVIYTQDTHGENYLDTNEGKHLPVKHCAFDTDGWRVVPYLDNVEHVHVLKETFGYTNWELFLDDDVEEIELVGVCTSICVVSNALILKAIYPEAAITVDANCCACVTPESHKHALETMKMCQINVIGE